MRKGVLSIGIAVFLSARLAGDCAEEGGVRLRVSVNFGNPPLIEKDAPFTGASVMQLLRQAAAVETSFRGAFVTAIEGRRRGRGSDWFYYVNGSMATAGAASFKPRKGDHIWWDLHAWRGARPVTALVGAYPIPFSRPGARIAILYAAGFEKKAKELASSIRGPAGVSCMAIEEGTAGGRTHRIYLGPWEALSESPEVRGLAGDAERCGLFVSFSKAGLTARGIEPERERLFPQAGAVVAAAHAFSAEPAVWLITGTDAGRAGRAADLLIASPAALSGLCGAVLTDDGIIPVPLPGPGRGGSR